MSTFNSVAGVQVLGRITPEYAEILTPEAVAFTAKLQRAFGHRRNALLERRAQRQAQIDAGRLPIFYPKRDLCAKLIGRAPLSRPTSSIGA